MAIDLCPGCDLTLPRYWCWEPGRKQGCPLGMPPRWEVDPAFCSIPQDVAALRQLVQELDRALWEEVESRPYPKDPWGHHLNDDLRDIREGLADA
jgi:hypothetical protein